MLKIFRDVEEIRLTATDLKIHPSYVENMKKLQNDFALVKVPSMSNLPGCHRYVQTISETVLTAIYADKYLKKCVYS